MRGHDPNVRPRLRDAIQLGDERHHVGHVLDDVTANYFIEFVVGKRIGYGAEIVDDVSVCFWI
jgi:hypothetical protein